MPRRSAEGAVTAILKDVKQAWKSNLKVAIILCDIENAFNAAWWPILITKLKAYFPHTHVLKTLISYLSDRKGNIECEGKQKQISFEKGCIQGSVLGPFLWNIVANDVLGHTNRHVKIYAYADDLTIVVTAECMNSLSRRAQKALNRAHAGAINCKLEFSVKKTVAMVMSRHRQGDLTLKLGEAVIRNVQTMKILGVIIDQKLTWQQHVRYIIEKASRIVKVIRRIAGTHWGTQTSILLHIYKMAYEPVIIYAADCWGEACKKKQIRKLLMRNQRETLIKCLRAYRTTSYHSLLALSGFSPLHIRVLKEYQQSHLNRVNVPEDEHLEQLYSLQNIVHPSEWKHLSHVCHETENAFFKRNEPIVDSVMSYYTDGSKFLEGTGAAFILVSAQGRHIRTKRFTLHPRCDVFQAYLSNIKMHGSKLLSKK